MTAPRPRSRYEQGFAVPTVLWVLVIFLLLSLATATVATTALSQSTRDGQVKWSLAAADAGIAVAQYRMNKLLLLSDPVTSAPGFEHLSGTTLLERLGFSCVRVGGDDVAGRLVIDAPDAEATWCEVSSADGETHGDDASFRYWVEMDPDASDPQHSGSLTRTAIAVGSSGGVERRLKGDLQLGIRSSDGTMSDGLSNGELLPDARWYRVLWAECPPAPSGTEPDSGC